MEKPGPPVKTLAAVRAKLPGSEVSMIALKLERVGDRLGVILDETARAELRAEVGETVYLLRSAEGGLVAEVPEAGQDDGRHERGRAFLKRYQKTLDAM